MSRLTPVLSLAAACTYSAGTDKDSSSSDATDTTVTYGESTSEPGDDDDTDPADSGRHTTGFDARYLRIDADLGYDAALGSLVEVQTAAGAAPPAIYFLFGTPVWEASGFDLTLDAEYCYVVLPLTSSTLAGWAAADATVWYGVDYVDGVAGVVTNCDTADHDVPDQFVGPDIPSALVTDYGGWGIGIGEWGPTIYNYYTPGTTTTGFFDTFVGVHVQNNGFVAVDDFYALPVAIDPVTHEALVNAYGFETVPAADVPTGTGIATAWYRIFGIFYYVF